MFSGAYFIPLKHCDDQTVSLCLVFVFECVSV